MLLRSLFRRRHGAGLLNTPLWHRALEHSRYAQTLPRSQQELLRQRARQFLNAKIINGAAGFEPTAEVCAVIALKASIPVLALGADWYDDWREVVVYPGEFRVDDEYIDDAGVVHREERDLCGQSLQGGPMVLSWQTILEQRSTADGDVVIHECAHKLDITNGAANGFPPLPSRISTDAWARAFTGAFERFCRAVENDESTALDPYGAVDPAEFFAVASEAFFTAPAILVREFPEIYRLLADFYAQDPYTLMGNIR